MGVSAPVPMAFGFPGTHREGSKFVSNTNQSGSMGNSSPSDSYNHRRSIEMDRSPASITSSSYGGLDSSNSRHQSQREQTMALTKSIDFGGSYVPNRLTGPGLPSKKPSAPISSGSSLSPIMLFGKTLNALFLLLLGIVLGSLLVTDSADWIYSFSAGASPLVSCPKRTSAFDSVQVLDGDACEMRFSFTSYSSFESSVSTAFSLHNSRTSGVYRCFQSDAYTTCSSETPCHVRCFSGSSCLQSLGSGTCGDSGVNWGANYFDSNIDTCAQTIYISNYNYPIKDARVSLQPLCGDNLKLTPGIIQTLRGELVAVAFILLLLISSSIIKAKRAPKSAPTISSQKALTIAKSSANELKALVESQWDSEYERRLQSKPYLASASSPLSSISPTGGLRVSQHLGSIPGDSVCVHPAKQFASSSWKYRVRVMHAMMRKREKAIWRDHILRTIFASLLLVTISFASTVLLLSVLPQTAPSNFIISPTSGTPSSIYSSIFAPIYNGGVWIPGTWVDALVVLDLIMELVIVVIALACGHKWTTRPSDRELWKLSNEIRASEDACMVITVPAGTCLRAKSRDRLVKLIETGLTDLKFGAVFVVDMGPSTAPADDTWSVVSRIDPVAVHYVYLPDTHRKLGSYWLSQVWIPFLYRNGRVDRQYKHFVEIDFENLTSTKLMDHPTLNKILTMTDTASDSSSIVMLPCKCTGNSDFGSSWENMRLSSEYFMRICESAFTGGLVISTNFTEPVCVYDQQRHDWQNMNPERAGLCVAKKRGKISVHVSTDSKPIGLRNSMYRNYSSMSQMFTTGVAQISEMVFALSSFKQGQSFLLKIFLLTGPVVGMFLVILRPFIIGSLLFRDPLGLLLLLLVAAVLSMTIHTLQRVSISRGGKKNKDDESVPYQDVIRTGSLASYPFYQMYLGCMRVGLSVAGCTFGRMKDEANRPSICSHKELYPCPPHPDIDWFTVWRTSDATRLSVLSTAIDASLRSNSVGATGGANGSYQDSWCSNGADSSSIV